MIQAFEKITVSDTAVELDVEKYKAGEEKANKATITVEDASIRFLSNGIIPTSTVGHLIPAGALITLETYNEIQHFHAIRATGSDAVIQVSYL